MPWYKCLNCGKIAYSSAPCEMIAEPCDCDAPNLVEIEPGRAEDKPDQEDEETN